MGERGWNFWGGLRHTGRKVEGRYNIMNQPPKIKVWEPWQPRVGNIVKIRISSECRCATCGTSSHTDTANGLVGEVILVSCDQPWTLGGACDHTQQSSGHRFQVRTSIGLGWSAAIELESLDVDDNPME